MPEHDKTADGDLTLTNARIAQMVGDIQPTGQVPELACAWDGMVRHIAGFRPAGLTP